VKCLTHESANKIKFDVFWIAYYPSKVARIISPEAFICSQNALNRTQRELTALPFSELDLKERKGERGRLGRDG